MGAAIVFQGGKVILDDGVPISITDRSGYIGSYEGPYTAWTGSVGRAMAGFPRAEVWTNGVVYSALREGESHTSNGVVRIISSTDGITWASVATITNYPAGENDLRECMIRTASDGRLHLLSRSWDGVTSQTNLFSWSSDGVNFDDFELTTGMASAAYWSHWRDGTNYVARYKNVTGSSCSLFTSTDGEAYTEYATITTNGTGVETAFTFDANSNMVAVMRGFSLTQGGVSTSAPPWTSYSETWTDEMIEGPAVYIFQGRTFVLSRLFTVRNSTHNRSVTAIYELVGTELLPVTYLPPVDDNQVETNGRGTDTGYGEFFELNGDLWCIYYAGYDLDANIYSAKIVLNR
jgi:hypothetical protein